MKGGKEGEQRCLAAMLNLNLQVQGKDPLNERALLCDACGFG